jgi:hypothetical protein
MRILFLAFFISRFLFLQNYPYFFDSPEYYQLSQTNFFQAVSLSHQSVHPVYFFTNRVFQNLYTLLCGHPSPLAISFTSAIFGFIGFIAFFKLSKRLFGKSTALKTGIVLVLFPHLWLLQTNIAHEPVEQGLFLAGLLTFDLFLEKYRLKKKNNKAKTFLLLASIFFWGLAVANFIGILIWFPIIFGFVFFRLKPTLNNLTLPFLAIIFSVLLGMAITYLFLTVTGIKPLERISQLVFAHGAGSIFSDWNVFGLARSARNMVLISWHGYPPAPIILFLFAIGIIKIKKVGDKKAIIILTLSFLVPFFISGKFWYGGLFGRYGSLVGYFFALIAGLIRSKKIYYLYLFSTFVFFLPTFIAYQKPPIAEIQKEIISKIEIDENDLLVLSDYQRPQLSYPNALYIVNDLNEKEIVKAVEKTLKNNKNVYISNQALTFPYWQYDGQQIHIVSKNNKKSGLLETKLINYQLKIAISSKNYPLLSVYQTNFKKNLDATNN